MIEELEKQFNEWWGAHGRDWEKVFGCWGCSLEAWRSCWNKKQKEITRLEDSNRKLREGIEKHRAFTRNMMASKMYYDVDADLYALIGEGK